MQDDQFPQQDGPNPFAVQHDTPKAVPERSVTNPLLQRIQMPGETFTIPSGGLFYDDGELSDDVVNGEIHVHPMTAIDEICMRTPDLLFSGDAVRQVFARCIPQVLKVDKLLSRDVDFLLICLRKVSYGSEMHIEYTHSCESAKKHTYTIEIDQFIRKAKRIDPTTVNTTFKCTIPNGQVVMMRPITFEGYIKVIQATTEDEETINPEKVTKMLIDSLSSIIISVDEIKDRSMINEWLASVPPSYIKRINESIDSTVKWGADLHTDIICKDCNKSVNVETPLNPLSFFI